MPWKQANLRPDQWTAIKEQIGEHGSVSSYVRSVLDDHLNLNGDGDDA